MNTEEIKEEIEKIIAPMEGVFLVRLDSKTSGEKGKLLVILDGDDGVTIDQCGKVSRQLSEVLEMDETRLTPYTLEVTSFGVGEPLALHRQYQNNVDRDIRVFTHDGSKIEGKLVSVKEQNIELLERKVQKHKKTYGKEAIQIEFTDIDKTKVLVSF